MDGAFIRRLAILLLGLFVVVFVVVQIARLFSSNDDSTDSDTSLIDPESKQTINNLEAGTSVRFTVEGKINAEEDHRSIRIIVTQTSRRIEVLKGYQGTVLTTKSYQNNYSAFREFMYALDNQGFTEEAKEPKYTEMLGVCSKGKRYAFELKNTGDTISSLWSSSCSKSDGTFGGSTSSIQNLFEKQIPDYNDVVNGVKL